METIIRNGRFFTVGENGAEMFNVKKDDIILNHTQTEELFSTGKVTSDGGRGKVAGGDGAAYVSGTYTTAGSLPGSNKFYNNYKWQTKKSKETKDDDFLENLDWIEVWLDRIERDIDNLDKVAGSAYKNFSTRNNKLIEEFSKVSEEINRQNSAYDAYMQAAYSVGLSADYMDKIINGRLSLETITDSEMNDKISQVQDFVDKALDARDAVYELEETLGDIVKDRFDNISTEYEAILKEVENRIDKIETGLDIVSAKGNFASANYYKALMSTEQENIRILTNQYNAMINEFNNAMSSGAIKERSEAWYDMQNAIDDVSKSIQEAQKSLIEYKNEMLDMDWSIFDKTQDYISQIKDESDFIVELLKFNEFELFDKDTGRFTNKSDAIAGLYAVNYNTYMSQADMYAEKVKELNKLIEEDPTNSKLIDQRNQYLQSQREAIKNANEEKKSIHSLISDSYQKMLEILQKLIDKRKDYLQTEKDLYEYQNSIEEKTKTISEYQKQLSSLQGDDSEDAMSKRQQIQESLKDAQKDLQETEYDKWVEDQEQLLDDLYNEYETMLNERLDNIDGLISEVINYTNENANTINETLQNNGMSISDTIHEATNNVGYNMTDSMTKLWDNANQNTYKVVSDYNTNFSKTMTTTNSYIQSCVDLLKKMVEEAKKQTATNTAGAATSSGGTISKPSTSNTTYTPSSSSSGSGSSSSSNKGSFFVYEKNYFPKNQLNTSTSIIDRLKFHDISTSWNNMKQYYQGMGLGSASSYTGTYQQNVAMLNWMKSHGYSKGGQLKKMISTSGEDGIFFGRSGEEVLSIPKLQIASDMTDKLLKFARSNSDISSNNQNIENNFSIQLNCPNVTDSESLYKELQSNKKIEQLIQSMVGNKMLGKNSLNKFKIR